MRAAISHAFRGLPHLCAPNEGTATSTNVMLRRAPRMTAHARWRSERTDAPTCGNCGSAHLQRQCPAKSRQCLRYGKLGHYAALCRAAQPANIHRFSQPRRNVRAIQPTVTESDADLLPNIDTEDPKAPFQVGIVTENRVSPKQRIQPLSVYSIDPDDEWCATLTVNQSQIRFRLDTGASANLIARSDLESLRVKPAILPSACQLLDYNGNAIEDSDNCQLEVTHKSRKAILSFEIVGSSKASLLGAQACKLLNLVQRVHSLSPDDTSAFQDTDFRAQLDPIINQHHHVFEGMGTLPYTYKILLKQNAMPVVHAPHRVPAPLKDRLKQQLQDLQNQGVISKVTEPTDWVSSMVCVKKLPAN
ncbi:uncharacterized protein [Scyliorhinus torazame]|uniref:uncharacterized protein n=1 Tax=Scyliorhinus torazame TaxID=75743 RepID=UPI003B5BE06C